MMLQVEKKHKYSVYPGIGTRILLNASPADRSSSIEENRWNLS